MIAWCWSMIGGCWSMVAWLRSMVTWSWSMVTRFMVGRWLCACAKFLPHSFWHLRDYLAWDLDALLNGDCLADLLWDFLFHLTNCVNKGIMGGHCFTCMGSSVQTVLGNSLHSFLGTLIGTSWHFLSGTFLHFVRGTWRSTFLGTCLQISLGTLSHSWW